MDAEIQNRHEDLCLSESFPKLGNAKQDERKFTHFADGEYIDL